MALNTFIPSQTTGAPTYAAPTVSEQVDVGDCTLLHAKIGALAVENDFLSGALSKAGLLSAKR